MIKKLSIWNYKSFAKAELPLSRVTFLIGANASGKSNALEVLRLAGWLGHGFRLDDIEKKLGEVDSIRGGVRDLFARERKPSSNQDDACGGREFRYRIVLGRGEDELTFDQTICRHKGAMKVEQLVISGESLMQRGKKVPCYEVVKQDIPERTDGIDVRWDNHKRGGKKPHVECSNRRAIFLQIKEGVRFAEDKDGRNQTVSEMAEKLAETLDDIVFISPEVAKMRGYVHLQPGVRLDEDGGNVSAVVCNICESSEDKKGLLEFIRMLPEQDIKAIDFEKTKNNDVMVELHEGFGSSKNTPASLLSDGTLRALAIGAALYNAPKGAMVVIEEIDNGIHPSRAKRLVDQLYRIAEARDLQIVVTTHNPALMDAIPPEGQQDVLCCYRNKETKGSEIRRLGDMPTFLDVLAQGALGKSATSERLEGWVTDKRSEADLIAQRAGWLANFKTQNGVGK